MKNLIVELQLDEKLDIADENDNRDVKIIGALLDKLHLNVVDFVKLTDATDSKSEQNFEDRPTLLNNETVVYVHLAVEPDNETFYTDGGSHNLLKYIADALDFRPSRVANYYEREDGRFTTTFIKITVGEVVNGINHI